jgi:methionyl-tRNA synthetase
VGRQVVVVANLEPVKIFGVESRGMLLAADINGDAVLLKPDKEVPAGCGIR